MKEELFDINIVNIHRVVIAKIHLAIIANHFNKKTFNDYCINSFTISLLELDILVPEQELHNFLFRIYPPQHLVAIFKKLYISTMVFNPDEVTNLDGYKAALVSLFFVIEAQLRKYDENGRAGYYKQYREQFCKKYKEGIKTIFTQLQSKENSYIFSKLAIIGLNPTLNSSNSHNNNEENLTKSRNFLSKAMKKRDNLTARYNNLLLFSKEAKSTQGINFDKYIEELQEVACDGHCLALSKLGKLYYQNKVLLLNNKSRTEDDLNKIGDYHQIFLSCIFYSALQGNEECQYILQQRYEENSQDPNTYNNALKEYDSLIERFIIEFEKISYLVDKKLLQYPISIRDLAKVIITNQNMLEMIDYRILANKLHYSIGAVGYHKNDNGEIIIDERNELPDSEETRSYIEYVKQQVHQLKHVSCL